VPRCRPAPARIPPNFPPSIEEADLELVPMYEAPAYKGSDKLKGMIGG
jgi:hypothetical protein